MSCFNYFYLEKCRNFRGDPVVLVAGGYSKGMELWNPAGKNIKKLVIFLDKQCNNFKNLDGFVETISMELPSEENTDSSLNAPQLVPIKQGKDLLLYGGSLYLDGLNTI